MVNRILFLQEYLCKNPSLPRLELRMLLKSSQRIRPDSTLGKFKQSVYWEYSLEVSNRDRYLARARHEPIAHDSYNHPWKLVGI